MTQPRTEPAALDWHLKECNLASLENEIQSSEFPVLVDFWADWCLPCRSMEPLLEQMADTYEGKVLFRKVNTDLNRAAASAFDIAGIPTLILFYKGKEVVRHVGAAGKKKLNALISESLDTNES